MGSDMLVVSVRTDLVQFKQNVAYLFSLKRFKDFYFDVSILFYFIENVLFLLIFSVDLFRRFCQA